MGRGAQLRCCEAGLVNVCMGTSTESSEYSQLAGLDCEEPFRLWGSAASCARGPGNGFGIQGSEGWLRKSGLGQRVMGKEG